MEPSDLEIASRYFARILLPLLALFYFCMGLSQLHRNREKI